MTKNAELILEIINGSDEHLTAEQIYLKLNEQNEKAALATVYNNLNYLYENDLIRKVSVEGYPDRYDRTIRHDHLICKKCGKISDIALEDMTEKLRRAVGEDIISYDLKINYICEECRSEEKE